MKSKSPDSGGLSAHRLSDSAWWRSRLSIWSAAADAPRKRRPSDAAALAAFAILLAVLQAPTPGPSDATSVAFLVSVPVIEWLLGALYTLAFVWALVLLLGAALTRHRRIVLLEQVIGGVLALVVAATLAVWNGAPWEDVRQGLMLGTDSTTDHVARLSVVVAVIGASLPHVSGTYRRLSAWILGLAVLAALALGTGSPLAVLTAVAVGGTAAAAVNLVFGSPGGHRPLALLYDEMADLGVLAGDLHYQSEAYGTVARGSDADGSPILVRLYNRDAFEGSLFSSTWDRLWYRRGPSRTSVGRQVQGEHEALITLLAERAAVPVETLRAAGYAFGRDMMVIRSDRGQRLAEIPDGTHSAAAASRAWQALLALHSAGIAHGSLSPWSVYRDGEVILLADFVGATTSPESSDFSSDHSRMLVTTALAVGVEDAVQIAHEALGETALLAAVPFLQPAAFNHDLRTAVASAPWSMKQLREAVATVTDSALPPLEKLRRVSLGTVALTLVVVVVAYLMIGAISGIGWSNIVAEFQGANWWWVLAGVLLATLVYVGLAIAMVGAAVDRLPFVPVLGLETSIAFIGLALPSSAAKIGLTVRFLQLAGSNPVAAVPISLIDSLSGLLVQILVIVLTLLTGVVEFSPSNEGGRDLASTLSGLDWGLILFVIAGVVAVAGLIAMRIPRARAFLTARKADTQDALRVFRSPRKVGQILGGSVMWNVVQALVLGCALNAFGGEATFAELILVNTLVALFSGLMPIPGNVGVAEAALTAGLVAVGVPEATAFSTAIAYRIATYYVPPIYGYVSLRTLRSHGYL